MSMFSKILLAIVIAVIAYALWPRDGSLQKWNPNAVAEAEATAWEALRSGNSLKASWNFYKIYDRQFSVSPITALNIARSQASSINSILRSPEPSDQERMIPSFVELNTRLRGDVKQEFDPAVAGRADYAVWVGVSEKADVDALSRLAAAQLAALFNQPIAAVTRAAELRGRALHAAFSQPVESVSWDKVRADLTGSWEAIKATIAQEQTAVQ